MGAPGRQVVAAAFGGIHVMPLCGYGNGNQRPSYNYSNPAAFIKFEDNNRNPEQTSSA